MSKAPSAPEEGIFLRSDRRRYLDLLSFKKLVGEDAGALVDDLVERQVLYRGFILKCQACRNADWFSIAEVSHTFDCKRCGRRQILKREHWRSPEEPSWYYKLDEVVYQGYTNGMAVPLLALNYLRRRSEETFLFTHELEFWEKDHDAPMIEADICCIKDGVLTIGEAKRDAALASGQAGVTAAEKYREIAHRVFARQVVFATLSEAWPPETVERIRKTCSSDALEVVFLTGDDLLHGWNVGEPRIVLPPESNPG